MYSIAIPTNKGSVFRFGDLARSRCLSGSPCTYLCDTSIPQVQKDVSPSYDTLVDLFQSMASFLSRLDIYTKTPLTATMTNIVNKIMLEVLFTLALVTKKVKQGRLGEPVSSLVWYSDLNKHRETRKENSWRK